MCVVCGCNASPEHWHANTQPNDSRAVVDPATGDRHYGASAPRVSGLGVGPTRALKLEADVLGENKRLAECNRAHFAAHHVTAFNLVSSPGSGKTTLLCATIGALASRIPGLPIAVIEGDQQTSVDADRIRAAGAPAVQVNTGRGCHLDAQMIADAFAQLDLHDHGHRGRPAGALLFIENVGNLVCPAMWDLGEAAKVVILSVTEGEDKPIKYPDMFAAAKLMLLNKVDLLPHVNFEVPKCIEYARRVNPGIEVLQVSAARRDGMDAWVAWLLQHSQINRPVRSGGIDAALRSGIAGSKPRLTATDVKP